MTSVYAYIAIAVGPENVVHSDQKIIWSILYNNCSPTSMVCVRLENPKNHRNCIVRIMSPWAGPHTLLKNKDGSFARPLRSRQLVTYRSIPDNAYV
jgi:hypothetical protein